MRPPRRPVFAAAYRRGMRLASSAVILPTVTAITVTARRQHHLVDSGAVPLDAFDAFYRNDETGAPAVSRAVLLKVVLLGYSRGLVSTHAIASACQRLVTSRPSPSPPRCNG